MSELAFTPTTPPEIPDKLYFRIGEVARLAGIKPYVLRFWESEFPGLGPKKSGSGHRLYRRKDVEMVLEIKHLLYEKRFTIEGARKFMETRVKPETPKAPSKRQPKTGKALPGAQREPQALLFPDAGIPAAFEAIRKELREIVSLLK
ncbi:MAG: MerR family transcriptional regulator [Bryobacteraceae bacterium]|nr:MerR family transcriptional regulator [Bryobacteraceae bacterium]